MSTTTLARLPRTTLVYYKLYPTVGDSASPRKVARTIMIPHTTLPRLPIGWERRFTSRGRPYYANNNTSTTTWTDPRPPQDREDNQENNAGAPRSTWEPTLDTVSSQAL